MNLYFKAPEPHPSYSLTLTPAGVRAPAQPKANTMKKLFSVEVQAYGKWLALGLYEKEVSAYRSYEEEIEDDMWDDVRVRMIEVSNEEVIMRYHEEEDLPW